MKKYIFSVLLILTAASCSRTPSARISGTFAGLDKSTVYLQAVGTRDLTIVDSTLTNSTGDFKFKVKMPYDSPVFYNVMTGKGSIPLIISPGDKVKLISIGDFARNYIVEGSEESALLYEFNKIYNTGISRMDSLSNLYSSVASADPVRGRELIQEFVREKNNTKREHVKFIVTNPSSMAALYAVYQRLPNEDALLSVEQDIAYYQIVADSVSVKYPDSPHLLALQRDIEDIRKSLSFAKDLESRIKSSPSLPEISLPDMVGKTRNLSDLAGKVTIIDFWIVGTESAPIINAEMKELYAEFRDRGLEIYQVNMGDNRPEWVSAITEQKLPWTTVYDSRGSKGMAAMSYNVTYVPMNVIVDRNGNIVDRDIHGTALRSKIEEELIR